MKAISLWQPWASLIAIGVKGQETRSWAPPRSIVGKRIAIHAARKPIEEATAQMSTSAMITVIQALKGAGLDPMDLPLGKVVCTAIVGEPLLVERFIPGDFNGGSVRQSIALTTCGKRIEANPFGDFSRGRWVWPMLSVERVEPFAVVGRQGIFDLEVATGEAETKGLFVQE
jgi:hypothetical protein